MPSNRRDACLHPRRRQSEPGHVSLTDKLYSVISLSKDMFFFSSFAFFITKSMAVDFLKSASSILCYF